MMGRGAIFKSRTNFAKLRRTPTSDDSGPDEGKLPVQRQLARQLTAQLTPPRSDSDPPSPTSPNYSPSPRRGGPSPFQDDDGDADLLMALCGRRRNGYGLVASVHCVWRLRWKEERPGSSCHAKQR
jgi:hypothetical protein